MKSKTKLLVLGITLLLLSASYWGFANTPYWEGIAYAYYILCFLLSVTFVLVSGGLAPVPTVEKGKKQKKDVKETKAHRVKAREKYRILQKEREEAKQEALLEKEKQPMPNLLHIPEEKRSFISQLLMCLIVPFYLIFLLDWLILFLVEKGIL